jgi:hypothetical protein
MISAGGSYTAMNNKNLPDIKMKMDSIPGKGICALWKGTSIFPYHRK